MNKRIVTILIPLFVLMSSCTTLDELTQFDMNFALKVTIEPTLKINTPFTIPTPPVTTNSGVAFSSNNTSKDLVDEIKLSEVKLTVESPNDEDFSILKSVEVYISASGEEDTKIAWLENIPVNESVITLDLSDTDLKDFIFNDEFSLKVKTVTDEAFTESYKVRIDTKVHVDAHILGI